MGHSDENEHHKRGDYRRKDSHSRERERKRSRTPRRDSRNRSLKSLKDDDRKKSGKARSRDSSSEIEREREDNRRRNSHGRSNSKSILPRDGKRKSRTPTRGMSPLPKSKLYRGESGNNEYYIVLPYINFSYIFSFFKFTLPDN